MVDSSVLKKIDTTIDKGYECLYKDDSKGACDYWLSAWKDVVEVLAKEETEGINTLEKQYKWTEMLFNWVQDFELELGNEGSEDQEYNRKRIEYCEEMLRVYPEEKADLLLVENTRRAIAESYLRLGDENKCDALFEEWLKKDPQWGWGWVGWSDCYWMDKHKDMVKAQSILESGLAAENVRDRDEMLDRAVSFYKEAKEPMKAEKASAELKILRSKQPAAVLKQKVIKQPVHVTKVGRNDPCPCGSGKKYKKCCGSES